MILRPFKLVLVACCCSSLSALPVAAGASDPSTVSAPALEQEPNPAEPPSSVEPPATSTALKPNFGEEIDVTADLDARREQIAPSLGAVTYKIGANQIQSMSQGEDSSFQQVLLHAPGVVQEEFGEIHVRGDHGDVQYRINGVLLPEGLNGFGQEIDPHVIKSVTLLTGTLPAQFGDRTAGIIDVTTKSGAQLKDKEISLYGGSYDTVHLSGLVGGTTTNLDYFVAASYLHDDLGIDNTTASQPLHDVTNQERVFGYFAHHFDPTSRLTLLASGSYADFAIPNTPGLSPTYQLTNSSLADSSNINERQNEQNYYAVLSYQKLADILSAQISAFTRYAEIRFTPDPLQDLMFNGDAAHVKTSDFANGLQVDGSYALGNSHTIRAGMIATYHIERLATEANVFSANSQFAPNPPDNGLPAPTPQSSSSPVTVTANSGNDGLISGVYLQDEWHLTHRLVLNYGARYDRFDTSFDHEDQLSPRANLVWQIGDATSLHAGYARYFMTPTLQYIPSSAIKRFEYTTGAPFNEQAGPQKVERDHYFDVGVSRKLTSAWQVTVDTFSKLAKNLLDDGQFGTAVILNNFNYAEGTVYGAELSSTYKQGPWSLYGNFSYVQTWARNIDSAEFEFPNNELAYLSAHYIQLDHQGRLTGSGGVAYTLFKNTRFYTDGLYGNGLRAGFANLQKLPAYWTENVGVEHVWHVDSAGVRKLILRLDCLNLFNQAYQIRDGTGIGIAAAAYGPRRAFYGGVTAVF